MSSTSTSPSPSSSSSSSSSSCNGPILLSLLLLLLLQLLTFLSQTHKASTAVLFSIKQRNRKPNHSISTPSSNYSHCDIFTGSWIRDESYPFYQASQCALVDPQFNCQLFGRPDSDYQRFRWKPNACDLPRFDGLVFLERMRGKTVMFVGDSLGRNQWESFICMVAAAVPTSKTQFLSGESLSTFRFLEYGVTVSFQRAPYLVDIDLDETGKKVLRLNDISRNALSWRDADVLSFDTGHWWTHKGALQGWDYMGDGEGYHTDMDRLVALRKGLATWANWVDANVDRSKTRVFFLSISPTHYNPTEWSDPVSKNCYGETVPVSGWAYSGGDVDQMRVLEAVLGAMKNPPYLLDITNLSALRKDAHPSIYSGYLNSRQRANPGRSADCSHWCLPGLPDTWNQLLYTALIL